MKAFLRASLAAGFGALLAAAPAVAAEGEHSPADSPTGQIFRWVNFGIVVVLIAWGFRKAAPYFRKHAEEISAKIAEGARAREAAETRRREVEIKLANLEPEVAALRLEAKRDSEAEALRLRAQAKEEAQIIERSAQAEIAAADRVARLELRVLAARMAIDRAGAVLRSEMTPAAEAALLKTFVAELDRSAN
ncbi:MAG: ATP synthase F0 subunit B [Candidatus Acidiferrales bacterium]